jgi:exonuclease SbcC
VIRRITLENYMSHARTVIEPAAGLTVLIGPNNCGKSAVVSALETLARSTRGDFMVRHGEKGCSVTVATDDGHVVTWKRKKGTVSFEIDGREVHRDVPDDLHEHLKLPLVDSPRGGEPFDVHFGQQKSPIFLLNEPDSRAATFFSASSDAGRLLEIQDRHREKVRDRKRDRSGCIKEIARLDEQVLRLEGVDSTAADLAKLEAEYAALLRDSQALVSLEAITLKLEELGRLVVERCEESGAFRQLAPPPGLHDTEPAVRLINEIQSCLAKASRAGDEIVVTKTLPHPPELSDDRALSVVIARLKDATSLRQRQHEARDALDPLRDAPELVDERGLKESIAKVMAARIQLTQPAEAVKALAVLHDPPELIDPAALEAQCAAITTATATRDGAARRTRESVSALHDVEQTIRDWIAANPSCPICGGVISTEALLEGGHAHAQ